MLMTGKESISLYIHIPFCTQKCDYCHFYVLPDKQTLKDLLVQGIRLEWEGLQKLVENKKIISLYFGGGTPYLLGAPSIAEIIAWISKLQSEDEFRNMEITLEANPENIEKKSLKDYHSIGINRLSIGIQSLCDHHLVTLSRRHSAKKGIQAIETASEVGFSNISIDLMYDLPGQTLESWEATLEKAADLPITHLSLYNLTIEPHTVFFKYRDSLIKQLPDDEISKIMYEKACSRFEMAGFKQYEISAFAKNGLIARHNSGYWTGRPFLGLGPSAFSYWEGQRFRNVANLSKYLRYLQEGTSPIDFSEKLLPEAHQRELLAIHLRLLAGVDLDIFEQQHGQLSSPCKKILMQLKNEGYLLYEEERWKLSRRGILFYDTVAEELIL